MGPATSQPLAYARGQLRWAFVAILLWHLGVPAILNGDSYLPRHGPAPLRFEMPSPAGKEFVWPVPLGTGRVKTNRQGLEPTNPSGVQTNAVQLTASSEKNMRPAQSELPGPDQTPAALLLPALTQSSLAASNLLILTPQMLSDYFKANLDRALGPGTNGPAAEVPFNPPLPYSPPSSEATYRVQ